MTAKWIQRESYLKPKPRGFHLITEEVLTAIPEIREYKVGLLHIFICHTSASLTINENVSYDVRKDLETHFNTMVPEGSHRYTHTLEGSDDMPAHIKTSILGSSLIIPVTEGKLNLGTWQGIYLCEHRNRGGSRKIVMTLHGLSKSQNNG